MTDSVDAGRLRELWGSDQLRPFDGQWIAFRSGEIRAHSQELGPLLEQFTTDISSNESPIFAFVWFEGCQ